MIKVGISGANGTMGRLTIGAIDAVDDLTVGGLYAPGRDGQDILGHGASGDPASLSECDVVIELTNPSAADENVPRWRDSGADVLIGTSGYTADRIDTLRKAWSALDSRCLVVPNFAIGAVLLMQLAERVAPHIPECEIVELHHDRKLDKPSGTAKRTAELIANAGGNVHEPIHSVRLPGLVSHQEVIFGGVGQTLSIRHDSTDRTSFMPGVLAAVKRIEDLPGLTIGLESVLGI